MVPLEWQGTTGPATVLTKSGPMAAPVVSRYHQVGGFARPQGGDPLFFVDGPWVPGQGAVQMPLS